MDEQLKSLVEGITKHIDDTVEELRRKDAERLREYIDEKTQEINEHLDTIEATLKGLKQE